MPSTIQDRFWAKVHFGEPGECWLWTGAQTPKGYGTITAGGHRGRTLYAHRLAYEWIYGPIPDGLTIDHLCRTTNCVNAHHLEVVSHRTNILRGNCPSSQYARRTHCANGHMYDLLNTYFRPDNGSRRCRACEHERSRKRRTSPREG